ncbi:MAG: hypothetical protein KDA42_06405 [Planctomycetales bacterium]|nr:hypothetical protein [Planctomycetales bacterium]
MSRFVCLETEQGETFVNLEQVCAAVADIDSVDIELSNGNQHRFVNSAAHTLMQALRHEERVAAAR